MLYATKERQFGAASSQCDATPVRGRKVMVGLAVAGLVGSGLLALAAPAQASAYGCTPYTSVRIKGVSPANWCGGPNGSGRTINSVTASFASSIAGVGYLCNTSMKVEVFNNYGQSVWTGYSGTVGGCGQAGGAFVVPVNRTFGTDGSVQTSLLSYGATKATLSHNIHA